MGALNTNGPLSLDDLKVTITSSSLLYPPATADEGRKRFFFLSNIDQVLNFNVETVHFFQANPDFPPQTKVVERLRSALERLLVPYEFLAGRLRLDVEEDRFVFDCNGAGVGFVVATSELALEEVGDLECLKPAFQQLVSSKLMATGNGLPPEGGEDQPLCIMQITSFKCGGFAMGISISHATFDGLGFRAFLENLAAFAADKPLAATPYNDRHLLAARSPPRVTFPHPELVKLDATPGPDIALLDSPATTATPQFKLFRLTQTHISNLKAKATSTEDGAAPSSFSVVTAHLWRCKALASSPVDLDETSKVLYAVDIRSRVQPPLPGSYSGNAVLSAYGSATYRELRDGPLHALVKAVKDGAARVDDEYTRSVVDWGQVNKGFPMGDVFISSWWRLGFADVEYPWGKPRYCCPVADPKKDIILLFPNIAGVDKGVNANVALVPGEMEKFEDLFYQLLL